MYKNISSFALRLHSNIGKIICKNVNNIFHIKNFGNWVGASRPNSNSRTRGESLQTVPPSGAAGPAILTQCIPPGYEHVFGNNLPKILTEHGSNSTISTCRLIKFSRSARFLVHHYIKFIRMANNIIPQIYQHVFRYNLP